MRRLLIAAALTALAVAKPEMYKETEDFKYSRSSTDEGSKSGFYGAQRGNMGGNFEKAHNMDGLAQHQMSGLVRQVDGELGDGYKTRTGSVYTAANSRGIYGSGHYDLSNLQGRNFDETEAFGDRSHSSILSQSAGFSGQSLANSAAYSNSRAHSAGYRRYQSGGRSQNFMQTGNLQTADQLHSADSLQTVDNLQTTHGFDYGSQAGQYSNAGYQDHAYDQSNMNSRRFDSYGLNTRSQIAGSGPVRIVVRPGKPVTVPLTAQSYDASHSTLSSSQSNLNSDAELLSTDSQRINSGFATAPKHYESSYSYRKQWEKHNTQPVAVEVVPTENPFTSQSESLGVNQDANLESSQHESASSYNTRASNSAYVANAKLATSRQSRYQTGYNAQQSSGSTLSSDGYNSGSLLSNADTAVAGADAASTGELLNTKPKSYHSSYSYHKSWERQGDPYVIQPVGGIQGGQASQKLTAASLNRGAYSSHHFGSQYNQGHQSFSQNGIDCDCDENGHVRVARSYDQNREHQFETYQNFNHNPEEFGQQSQSQFQDLQDFGQQAESHLGNLEDLGQQVQTEWDVQDTTGYNQEQMANSHFEQQNEHKQWGLHNFGQQTEGKFDKINDLGQQTVNKLEKLEDFGQESQAHWNDMQDLGQQTQGRLEDLGQQSQNKWDKIEDLGQQLQGFETIPQPSQNSFDQIEDSNQQLIRNLEQQIQQHGLEESKTDGFEHFSQQTQDNFNIFNLNHLSKSEDNNFDGHYRNQYSYLNFDTQHQHDNTQTAFLFPSTHHVNRNFETFGSRGVHQYTSFSHNSGADESNINNNHNSHRRTEEDQTSNSLSSIWDKIDTIAKKTLNDDKEDITQKPEQKLPNWLQNQVTNESNVTNSPPTTEIYVTIVTTTESDISPPNAARNPNDIGRGDIGPEDIFDTSEKPYKTPKDIEALSLTHNEENISSQLNLENSNKESDSLDKLRQENLDFLDELMQQITKENEEHSIQPVLSTTSRTTTESDKYFQQSRSNDFNTQATTNSNLTQKYNNTKPFFEEQQNVEQQFNFGQQMPNLGQQTHDLGKQFEEFGQQTLDLEPQTYVLGQETYDFGQQTQDLGQQTEDFGQQTQDFVQQDQDITQLTQDLTQQTQDFTQQTQDLTQQTQDLSQQTQDLGQQLQTAWDTENLGRIQNQDINESFQIQSVTQPNNNFEQQQKFQNMHINELSKPELPNINQKQDTDNSQLNQNKQPLTPSEYEKVTEKPGFWHSVGSKLKKAKDSVYSWFSNI